MEIKYCIFNEKKVCDNCGECDVCDLDSNKKCDNCGKCLEKEGYDTKAIKITDVNEDKKFINKDEFEKSVEEIQSEYKNWEEIDEFVKDKNNKDNIDSKEKLKSLLEDYNDDYKALEDTSIENREDITIEFIDDIDGLEEVLEDDDRLKRVGKEQFPGFIKLNDKDNN
ncbi:hypothetical protein [Clostridium oceanicum]|uniref:Uncharacterized protein n=1 Tax=Clostridium oceanicum TaxID=1543 RepID=A0ABN1JJ33_9CLOT